MSQIRNGLDSSPKIFGSPSFPKTARQWVLSSALYDGVEDEDIRQIETLLGKGADPNILLAEYGIAPFHFVVVNENTPFAIQATDICLQHQADPNVRSEDGLTPVHLAAMWGCQEVLYLLLASGGDPWLVDCFHLNAFDYARKYKQQECLNILRAHNHWSQPKASSTSLRPCQLNLKRVVLYKNDVQVIYETSPPTTPRQSASTQTSPNNLRKHSVQNGNHNFNDKSQTYEKLIKNYREKSFPNFHCNFPESTNGMEENSTANSDSDQHHISLKSSDCPISNRLKEVINNHRRNSIVFESGSTSKQEANHPENTTVPPRNITRSNHELSTRRSMVSELAEKLNLANKLRQSLKVNEKENDVFKNITHRKKAYHRPPSNLCVLREESPTENVSKELSDPPIEVGGSPIESVSSSKTESPPSISFILDNLEESCQIHGSSLFSDIASGVSNNTFSKQDSFQTHDIMTEDETSSEKQCSKYSLSDSLRPYVTCDNVSTRDGDSSECFESCMENIPTMSMSNACSVLLDDVHSAMDSILNNIDADKVTPVNRNLVTSTPERISSGSDKSSPLTTVEPKQKWVEAKILSSEEEDPYMSISEEYEYTDLDEGVVLIEKRYLTEANSASGNARQQVSSGVRSSASEESEVSTVSGSDGAYDTDDVRRSLHEHGFPVGPITSNTKRLYLRRLKRLRRRPDPPPPPGQPAYSAELLRSLQAPCEHLLYQWAHLEDSMAASFSCQRRAWRQGQAKTSFTYLLLNPALLPPHRRQSPFMDFWPHFLRAVFYVGKGKRARPYSHLYEAVAAWQQRKATNSSKIQQIIDIWNSGQGVVCLHVFQNIIPVEALTREAAMISALTVQHLTNEKAGEFYGSVECWNLRLKRRLGCVLLHRACQVFLAEGERQLRPADID